jgi:hypothetical protein
VPEDATDIPKWTYALHKKISQMTKSTSTVTYKQAQQKWSKGLADVRDYLPFLDSIAMTHPSARSVDAEYRDHLHDFVVSLVFFVDLDGPKISKESIASRYEFKLWLNKLKKRHHIDSKTVNVTKCTSSKCNL